MNKLIDRIQLQKSLAKDKSIQINVLREMQNITGENVLNIFFTEDLKADKIENMSMTDYLAQVFIDVVNQQIENPLSLIVGDWILKLGLTSTDRRLKLSKIHLTSYFNQVVTKRRGDKDAKEKYNDLLQTLLDYNTQLK